NTDTSSQNFYLYSPQNGNKWYFIPWDNDGAWQFGENLLFDGVKGYNFKFGVSNYWGSMLHQRVLKSAEYRKKLDDKVNEMRSILTKDKLKTLVSGYSAITRKYLYAMPDKMYATQTEKEFDQILETIPKEIDSNYEMYLTSLRRPCPFYLAVPEYLGDKMLFQWDASYDFSGEDITYSFELSRDYKMQTVIKKQENLAIPQMLVPKLPPGQYFYRVNARNKSGETQTAMEIYEAADDQKYFGTLSFYVMPDGSIQGA
ncbi:MAG: CotH kinase family protein, partial [Clostridia bacterium]